MHGSRVIGVAASPRSAYEIVELDTAHRPGPGDRRRAPTTRSIPRTTPNRRSAPSPGPTAARSTPTSTRRTTPTTSAPTTNCRRTWCGRTAAPPAAPPLVLDLEIAYFTSRGIGVAEVNYGGSTGYGREYRNRLREQWGVVDVEDCAAVALALADEGTADRDRLAIRGGSAGGWTTAASLTSTDVYACGTIIYPILDLAGWGTGETHDFESQYLESLVGPLAEVPDRYARAVADRARRPAHRARSCCSRGSTT